jgi:protocatechuate 4,5-dioxygenase, beta chain
MAKLVAAVTMMHHPHLYSKEQGKFFSEESKSTAFDPVRRMLKKSSPDTVLIVANDHLDNFFLDNMPAFAVGISEEAEGPFIGELEAGMPKVRRKVDSGFAEEIAKEGMDRNIDFSVTRSYKLDHAYTVPIHLCLSDINSKIIPIFTNCFSEPLPKTERFFTVGKTLKDIIEHSPRDERVAVISSFNFSSSVGDPKWACDPEFDQVAKEYLLEGKVKHVLEEFSVERLERSGKETREYLNYVVLLGMIGDRKPDHFADLQPKQIAATTGIKFPIASWEL